MAPAFPLPQASAVDPATFILPLTCRASVGATVSIPTFPPIIASVLAWVTFCEFVLSPIATEPVPEASIFLPIAVVDLPFPSPRFFFFYKR